MSVFLLYLSVDDIWVFSLFSAWLAEKNEIPLRDWEAETACQPSLSIQVEVLPHAQSVWREDLQAPSGESL